MKSVEFLKKHNVDVDKSLELFGDMGIYNETMQDFLDGIEEKKTDLKKYKDLDDWANYAIYAHSIKSDARYLGFTSVAEVALQHEMAGKESNQHFIEKDYDHLVNITNEMISIVKDYLTGDDSTETSNITPTDTPIVTTNENEKEIILVADDSHLVSNFATKMLDKYEVVVAKDGKEVLDIINSNKYKILCLLLDLNMPNVNGFQVLDYFSQNNLFAKIPVSIITGEDSKDAISKAFQYNIVDMLVKPFSKDDINRVVDKTINIHKM
jgi:CheY-like chemotaxis protein/HPt (histidine-containing phosphotransfer) domain-containing protein